MGYWITTRALAIIVSITALLGATGLANPAQAQQTAPPSISAERSYNIPSQDLNSAILSFANMAGVQVFYDVARVQGMRSTAISGTFRPQEALTRLLAGTGMSFRFTSETTVSLESEASSAGGAVVLNPIAVEGVRPPADPGRTEGTASYAGSQATVGSKTPTTIREIPQSVSVVTRQKIEDRNYTTFDQAMRETTGVVVTPNDSNGHIINSRGFQSQTQIDGLAVDPVSIFSNQFDLAIFDRLEVLRGPSGLFSGGSSTPSGVINMVHKRPGRDFAYGGAASVGSWNFFRGEGDVTGPLFESDRVRGRLVAVGQDNDTFVDVTHSRRGTGFGAVDIDLTEATTLSLGSGYQDQNAINHGGLPAYTTRRLLDVDRSTFLGADWNTHETILFNNFANLEHRFDNGVTGRVAARQLERKTQYKFAEPRTAVTPGTNTTNLTAFAADFDQADVNFDGYVSAPVQAFGQEHKFLLGADYGTVERTQRTGLAAAFATVNVFSPNPAIAEPNIPLANNSRAETEQYGTYTQARIKPFAPLTLIGGARLSWYDTKSTNLNTNAVTANYSIEQEVTPYYGAIVDVTDNLSLYGAYSDIFVPQNAASAAGTILPPRVGSQYEAGVKAELFDKALIAHVAAFRIEDENRAITDPNNANASVAAGVVRSEGFEGEISGKLTPELDVSAGYAYTNTYYVKDATMTGMVFDGNTPKHSLNLWAKYTFQGGPLDRWSLGGGGRISSSIFAYDGAKIEQDAYVVANIQVGYALTDDFLATLTVNNIFDESYYQRIGSASAVNFYGEPRSVWFTVRKSF